MIKVTMLEDVAAEGARKGDPVTFMDDELAQRLIAEGKAKPHEAPKAETVTLTAADVGVLKL